MRVLIFGMATVLCSMFITSCSSTEVLEKPTAHSYKNVVMRPRGIDFKGKIINKQESLKVTPVVIKDKSESIITLNNVLEQTNDLFTRFLLQEAETYIGAPYRYGGTTKKGIDCSAFVKSVFEAFHKDLPRVSSDQAKEGVRISKNEARVGDLVFFATKGRGRVSHVGIIHGRNKDGVLEFIHSSTSRGVVVSALNDSYWGSKFLYIRRIL